MCVIASGASAPAAVASLPRRVTTLAVNRGFELAPWADALYAADASFWERYPAALEFPRLKCSAMAQKLKPGHGVERVGIFRVADGRDRPIREPIGTVAGGGNSGFQAVNLAAQFGARRIVLIGFDMGGTHWHGDHAAPLRNPRQSTLAEWRQTMDEAAPVYAEWNVEVLNASPISALTAYRKVSVRDALRASEVSPAQRDYRPDGAMQSVL